MSCFSCWTSEYLQGSASCFSKWQISLDVAGSYQFRFSMGADEFMRGQSVKDYQLGLLSPIWIVYFKKLTAREQKGKSRFVISGLTKDKTSLQPQNNFIWSVSSLGNVKTQFFGEGWVAVKGRKKEKWMANSMVNNYRESSICDYNWDQHLRC